MSSIILVKITADIIDFDCSGRLGEQRSKRKREEGSGTVRIVLFAFPRPLPPP